MDFHIKLFYRNEIFKTRFWDGHALGKQALSQCSGFQLTAMAIGSVIARSASDEAI